ncbi:DUF5700 domain-containing putative Zn-dependent protease [Deminuibacter soli]|uniref:Peptidase M48 domain-containing protein n=1 Tax=Deminuibacter soli TaxID=2291815 RepID=A0A3E1NG95_9BACT|nr:DUF5700 domain-containing putative Zn-dependent protease [Deminuibacter soli]RFM26902.1 hypothetical protein DXN05_18120 [Deminuibacter soli]
MKFLLFTLLLCFVFLSARAQIIEDSTCFAYFKITDRLRRGDTLDKATWHNFVQNKAIQVYMNDQGANDNYYEYYRRLMQIVYMPQKDSILQRQLKDSINYWFTYLIYQYKVNEEGMKAYLHRINANPGAYFDSCYKYCYTGLAVKDRKKAPDEIFSFIPLHSDAHAENKWVIYSLLCAYFNDKNKLGILGGHELHHVLRPQKDIDSVADKDRGVLTLMLRTVNEGSADLVDKKYMTYQATALLDFQRGTYEDFYSLGQKQLPRIDSLLQLSATRDSSYTLYQLLKGADNSSGHVPGTYMAYTIEQAGLKQQLLAHLDDPFYFFSLYDEASRKKDSKAYRFSFTTVNYLKQLQQQYRDKWK